MPHNVYVEITVDANGTQVWRNEAGELHREGGLPAVVWANGDQEWYMNGKLHREGGKPAVTYANGIQAWFVNGLRHRDGGLPAIIWDNGRREWFVNGEQVTEEEARELSPPPVQGPTRTRFHLIAEW